MKITRAVTLAALAALLASPALSQKSGNHQGHSGIGQMHHDHISHGQTMMLSTAANPYPPVEMRMHDRMMGAVGANADETWVRKMIEHHRGAIEMSAKKELPVRGQAASTRRTSAPQSLPSREHAG